MSDIVLPAGSFVCPIDWYYVPKHVKESDRYRWFDKETHSVCYTRFGLVPIAKRVLRER